MKQLESLFNPKSIAVVGVSNDPSKLGSVLFTNIIDSGFQGKLYPVNPKYNTLFNYKVYKRVSDIPSKVDLVCIAIPAPLVTDIIRDAGKKKIKAAIIITAGFGEIGGEGLALEKELKEVARKTGIKILGPNCLGMINPLKNINASFAASNALPGNIAFLSQSGAFCTAILDMSLEKRVGFSHMISLGNKIDINENELIEYWQEDQNVEVIGAYLEEIKKGQKLLSLVQKKRHTKPLIVFKPGETQEAKRAISSHTGSMAGSSQVFKTAVKQNGIIEVNEVNQMFHMMMAFSWTNIPRGNRVAVITNAGGPGIIATDEIVKSGLKMADISGKSKSAIQKFLPSTASIANPIDVIGDALAERYRAPIDILAQDDNVDAILVLLTPQLVTQIEETAKLIINSSKLTDKPILTVFLGGKYVLNGLQRLYDQKMPAFRYISDAVDVLSKMYEYSKYLEKKNNKYSNIRKNILKQAGKGKYRKELQKYLSPEETALPELMVVKLAQEVGIKLPRQIISTSVTQAVEFAEKIYPVVIKATTEAIPHKSDEKALYLNIASEKVLRERYVELTETVKRYSQSEKVEILVQEQVLSVEELLVGANRDGSMDVYEEHTPGFGHLIIFGKGGIYTEIYQDFESVLVPASDVDIYQSFSKTKVAQIIHGARGQKPLAEKDVLDTIQAVQKMVLLYPEISSLDINPLLVSDASAVAVDLKVFVKQ